LGVKGEILMSILVTGSEGMLGQALVRRLEERDYVVVTVDKRTVDGGENLEFYSSAQYTTSEEGLDTIIDCACDTCGINYSRTHHADMFRAAALVPMQLLAAAAENGVRNYVQVSSSCVFSDIVQSPKHERHAHSMSPEAANEGYGWGKRTAEIAATMYAAQYGMRVFVARPGNIYGPSYRWNGQQDKHVIPALIERILGGENPLEVWGTGEQTRNFIYEDDCADAIIGILEKGEPLNAYNLEGDEISIRELALMLIELCGSNVTPVFDASKPMGPMRKVLDTGKLQSILGPTTRLPFSVGLKRTVDAARKAWGK
jgi:GDP-L-fucose synthase